MADNTVLTGQFSGFLTPAMAAPYFEDAARISVVQQIARQVPLGANGQTVPVVTSKMTASWVGEGGRKPNSKGGVGLKTITPKKIAAIAVVSAEVVRANPGGYMGLIRPQISEAIALAFDAATLHGTNTPFDQYIDQTSKAVELGAHTAIEGGVWQDLNSALRLLVDDGKKLNGFLFDDVVEPTLNGSVDNNGRPIYVESPLVETAPPAQDPDAIARRGRTMGRTTFMNDGVASDDDATVVGYAGDWRQCVWGTIGGISYDISTQASVTIDDELVSLWENNLVAIRAEAEFGFLCNDVDAFVRLQNLVGS